MSQNFEDIASQVNRTKSVGQPPLDQWHPDLSGDMDLRVSRDGQWIFKGEPLAREAIVRLFSTILRLEDDGEFYWSLRWKNGASRWRMLLAGPFPGSGS